jgi:hypothetical protein
MTLYREIRVWRRLGPTRAVQYVCFERLVAPAFCVQSADFYDLPVSATAILQHSYRFLELFIEEAPSARCDWFSTLEAAIEQHDREFGSSPPS